MAYAWHNLSKLFLIATLVPLREAWERGNSSAFRLNTRSAFKGFGSSALECITAPLV
jgi:hypothetical protein